MPFSFAFKLGCTAVVFLVLSLIALPIADEMLPRRGSTKEQSKRTKTFIWLWRSLLVEVAIIVISILIGIWS